MMPDLFHDLGVGQRGDVADVGEVGHGRDDPAHDLAGPGLRHVGDDPDVLRPRDLADHGLDRLADLDRHLVARLEARLERYVYLDEAAADVVDDRHRGRLGDLGHGERGRLDLLGAQPVPGHVDHVVHAAQDPVVPVGGLHGAVVAEVRPVPPVRAVRVLVVLAVIGVEVPLGITPDRLEDAGPGVADADVARLAAALRHLVAVLVVDHREHAEYAGAAAARLHRLQGGRVLPREPAVSVCQQGVGVGRLALPAS